MLQKYPKGSTTSQLGFVLVKPDNYTTSKKYPVICFLHGIGGIGDGSDRALDLLVNGELPKQVQEFGPKYDFIVIAPQIPNTNYTGNEPDSMFDWLTSNVSVDMDQLHVTGLSLGAGGALRYATSSAARASRLATLSFVATTYITGNYKYIADANLAAWGFHNLGDNNGGTPPAATTYAVTAINSYGGFPAIKTMFNAFGHGGWGEAYGDAPPTAPNGEGFIYPAVNIYQWMAMNRRGKPVAVPGNANDGTVKAVAGADYTSATQTNILDGRNSQNYVSASWSIVSVPAGVDINNSGLIFPKGSGWYTINVFFPKAGDYTFRLAVKGKDGTIATDDVKVTYAPGPQTSTTTTTSTTQTPPTKIELGRTWIPKLSKFVYVYDDGTTELK